MLDDTPSNIHHLDGRREPRRSRSYPVEGRAMPRETWPAADREAWEAAVAPGIDFLDEPGAAAHLAPSTQQLLERTWGQFLAFLDRGGELDPSASPTTRATPERIGAWLESLKLRLRASAIQRMLIDLSTILVRMVPDRDWSWIRRHPARPSLAVVRASRKLIKTFDTFELNRALHEQINLSADLPRTPARALEMRNLLLTTVALYTGLRRRNLTELQLGSQVRHDGEQFVISLEASETKTGRPISFGLAPGITPMLRAYIADWRPMLLNGQEDHGHLWLTSSGAPVCDATVSRAIQGITRRLIGRAVNPHLIRHTMATELLIDDPLALRTAAAALGHSSSRSVNEVYDRSGSEGAHRLWRRMLLARLARTRRR